MSPLGLQLNVSFECIYLRVTNLLVTGGKLIWLAGKNMDFPADVIVVSFDFLFLFMDGRRDIYLIY